MATVTLSSVGKIYEGGVRAVRGVSMSIADGEFVVLVGPSGCGKSTTLRMIAGLEDISEGTISIGDRVVNEVEPADRNIAMVFQNYALYPHLTVKQNLAFGLDRRRRYPSRLRAMFDGDYGRRRLEESSQLDARIAEAARMLGIDGLLRRMPRELSGGQRQRVAVGRAIVRNPAAFLFDEPLSNLDARLRQDMRTELRLLHRRLKSTMIYVTHDQEEAMSLADRIVVMKDGVVQQLGTPGELFRTPANAFVAGFIGTPAMNLIRGRVGASGGAFKWSGGKHSLSPGAGAAADRDALMGVRPERVSIEPGDEGTLETVEVYGETADLVARIGDQRVVARIQTQELRALREGEGVSARFADGHAHLFDAQSGEAIAHGV
ncbi:MAG: sn-glycerol-3-phosphate ABC transporter ATP-binding protein UgpC [Planctomycetota bacterium]|nr:sn-glycerol-3-phosphate ABC transporter ATP-binding protein UgpC [Planctomycetota bacterium]MDA1105642.1 sn-glycerol-3-phosphate ABC transporter ATP-binding protein UgpC [Planctomycetota bacterium]